VILALLKKAGFINSSSRAKYKLSAEAKKNLELVLNLHNYETKKAYDQSKLAMMLQYCETSSCRRKFILNYFGEDYEARGCGACDNCLLGHQSFGSSGYRIADVVFHPKFGQGTVERAEKDLVTVLFPGVGYKTLLATAVSKEAKIA
jgi:ATP-dependent DNA helicase RecQ